MTAAERLKRLLVKDHVHLGSLPEADRSAVFAMVWAGLPNGGGWTEREANGHLKARLSASGAFLGVDHVELRRWLCDLQWLQRDDYGRAYRKVPMAELRPALAALAAEVVATEWDATAAELRAEKAAHRIARRAAWEQAQAA